MPFEGPQQEAILEENLRKLRLLSQSYEGFWRYKPKICLTNNRNFVWDSDGSGWIQLFCGK